MFKQIKLILICIFLFFSFALLYGQSLDTAFDITASGIVAQKIKLNIIAQNIANVSSLKDEATGLPYQKRYVVLRPTEKGVKVESIELSNEPFGKYFDSESPQSDADGFYYFPNVNIPDEMVNMNFTEIIYEANTSAFKSAKAMYQQTLEILK